MPRTSIDSSSTSIPRTDEVVLPAFRIPRTRRRVYRRDRLRARLDALLPLTIIRGLPGTGKTTLSADWLRGRERVGDEVLWFTAGTAADVELLDRLEEMLAPESDTPLVVVVDDAHHFKDDECLRRLCRQLVEHHRLHVVLCTRRLHPVRKHADADGVEWAELSGRDLNARDGELLQIAQAWGHDISPQREAELLCATGGWLEAARRALDECDPERDASGQLAADGYVHDEVIGQVAAHVPVETLMLLSVPSEITLGVARSVEAGTTSLAPLMAEVGLDRLFSDLENECLLEQVPPAGESPTWRMPTLLRDVLSRLFMQRHPTQAVEAHAAAARALAASAADGSLGDMIRHARTGQEWELLGHAWNAHGLLLASHHGREMLEAYGDIPAHALWIHTPLAMGAAVVTALRKHADPRMRATAMRNYANAVTAPRSDGRSSRPATETMEVCARMVADRLGGDPERSLRRAREHHELLERSGGVGPPAVTLAWFELHWGLAALASEEVGEGLQLLEAAADTAHGAGAELLVAAATSQLASWAAIAGHGPRAVEHLEAYRSVELTERWLQDSIAPAAHLAAGVLALARLDPGALDFLEQAGDGSDSIDEWALLAWARAQHALLFGDVPGELGHITFLSQTRREWRGTNGRDHVMLDRAIAELLLAAGEFNRCAGHLEGPSSKHPLLAVPRARLALIVGDLQQARTVALGYAWREGVFQVDRAELFMVEAAAALRLGDEAAAIDAFARAHGIAVRAGSWRPYANLPRATFERLLQLARVDLGAEAAERIRAVREPYPAAGELVRLTPRELAVLQAMSDHETLADVANELTVSLNTVKKQSLSIYTKLGVGDRSSALVEAHRLGLLSEPPPGRA